jgi:hypothetical protein
VCLPVRRLLSFGRLGFNHDVQNLGMILLALGLLFKGGAGE